MTLDLFEINELSVYKQYQDCKKGEEKMKVGLIGLGSMGSIHLRILKKLQLEGSVKDIRVHDSDMDTLSIYSDIKMDFESLIDWSDAVVVATPTDTHFVIARKVLEKKKPVFIEKPVVFNRGHLEALCQLAFHESETLLFGGYIERYNPIIQHLKKMLQEEDLGEIFYITTERVNNVPRTKWRKEGIVRDLGVHDFDLLSFLFGQSIMAVNSCIVRDNDIDIFASVDLVIGGKIKVNTRLSWIDTEKRRCIRIYAEKCVMTANLLKQEIQVLNRFGRMWYVGDQGEPAEYEMRAFLKAVKSESLSPDDTVGITPLNVVAEIFKEENII